MYSFSPAEPPAIFLLIVEVVIQTLSQPHHLLLMQLFQVSSLISEVVLRVIPSNSKY